MSTFVFDAYKDKTLPEMKKRCRELVRAVGRWERIALTLAAHNGTQGLSAVDAEAVNRLLEAYKD